MQTITVWSFRLNGWVNYEFPTSVYNPEFKPMHATLNNSGEYLNGFAYTNKKDALRHTKPNADNPSPRLAAAPREWAKFPQVFDSSEGHSRTFFR